MHKFVTQIAGIKSSHMLDKKSMRNILSLVDFVDSHGATMGTIIYYEFCAHASKGIAHHG